MPKTITGINDLVSHNPTLAAEWHPNKNGDLMPKNIAYSSKKKVWWLGKCGHEWRASVGSRNIGRGCPICAGIVILPGFNDLASNNPDIASEWDREKNTKSPSEVGCGTHEHACWKCKTCGFSWYAEIRGRVKGTGCPNCNRSHMSNTIHTICIRKSGTFADMSHDLLKEWNYNKNLNISPKNITPKTMKKVWWICSKCGYEWEATVSNRSNGSGCPSCSGAVVNEGVTDLKTCHPELLNEWDYSKNTVLPEKIHSRSGKKIHWKCKYGHEWEATAHDRVMKGTGCPICSKHYKTSFAEQSIFYYVRKYYPDAQNRYKNKFLGNSEIDIFIPSRLIGIEYDGQRYHLKIENDRKKDLICEENGITLIRVREPKCIPIKRTDPTIVLKETDDSSLSKAIYEILAYLWIENPDVNIERDRGEITVAFHSVAINDSIDKLYPTIAKQWANENLPLAPQNVSATKVKTKYYWKCEKCGHVWKAPLSERINGTGCPVCANRIVIQGINDLETTHSYLAKEWDYEKNQRFSPQTITFGCTENVWWICSKCGCNWNTRVNRRVNGSGCPNCAIERRKKEVYQFDLNGQLINRYDSVSQASKETGISTSAICYACKAKHGSHIRNGFAWSYINSL